MIETQKEGGGGPGARFKLGCALASPMRGERKIEPLPVLGLFALKKSSRLLHSALGFRHNFFRSIWLVFALGILSGCVRFEPRELSPDERAHLLEARSLTNVAFHTFLEKNLGRTVNEWPPVSWDFEMLTWAALYYHPTLELARAEWFAAKGGEQTANQRPNPTFNVTPGYNSTTAMPSPWLPLTFLDIPIETAGKRGYRRVRAAHLSEAARLNVATVAWQVRSNLRVGLLDLETAEHRQGLLRRQLASQEQILKALEQQAEAGAIAASELYPARISLIKLRLDVAEAERSRAEARVRVAEALGIPNSALEDVKLAFDPLEGEATLPPLTAAEVRRAALQSRPDILGALSEYAAAQSALQLEIAKQYPDVHLQPGYQFDQGDNKWSLGLILDLPLFNQNQGPIAEAKARRQEAARRFDVLQAKVLAEIDRATEVLRVTQQTTATLRSLAVARAQRLESVAAQVKAGATDQLEFLSAQAELIAADLVQLDGQFKFRQAIGALEDAVRRPLELPRAIFESSRTGAP